MDTIGIISKYKIQEVSMPKYYPTGVCSKEINFTLKEDMTLEDIYFVGGCDGNLQGISNLVKGMNIDEVINKLEGIRCGRRNTSCPDQLSKALKEFKQIHE